MKVALCQNKVFVDKKINIKNALLALQEAADNGAVIAALPEMFNCPYGNEYFSAYSEIETVSDTLKSLQEICKKAKLYLVAGSIPERLGDKIYNTSYFISPKGEIMGKQRKLHLFDVKVQNGPNFLESASITRGDKVNIFSTEFGKIGVCICYDLRFPELFRRIAALGADIIFVPAAFAKTTGVKHWELLLRTRALDNQVYIAGVAPAADSEGGFEPYGNSILANPWGEVISKAGEAANIIYGEIDINYLKKVRQELPVIHHLRPELY